MTSPNPNPNPSTAMARAILDELARGGVRLVVVSPGSRSTALAVAAVEHQLLETIVALDERSAGFHALGRAKADGSPAVVICTSGTAAANYYPAVIEAEMSLAPLVVMTADRPAELRGVGANQTIDQVHLYGDHVRFFADIEAPTGVEDGNSEWRTAAATAVDRAMGSGGQRGPVHLNVAFREPTVPVSDDGRARAREYEFEIEGRDGGRRWTDTEMEARPAAGIQLPPNSRGLVVAGEGEYDRSRVLEAAQTIGWPVLATAQSGMRGREVVSSYHHILAADVPVDLTPDVLYVIGSVGPSRRLENLIESSVGLRFRIDAGGRHIDPGRSATEVLAGDAAATLETQGAIRAPQHWASLWQEAESRVSAALTGVLQSAPLSGPKVAADLSEVDWDRLVVASSLPIRDVDAHLSRPGQVIANRGASGIDGFVSTALGAASAGGDTVALTGDLSLLHDSNGFLIDSTRDLVIVVVDNGGGGLFDSLPQAVHAPSYERLFFTPHGRDFARLAALHHLSYLDVQTGLVDEVSRRLSTGGLHLLRVGVERTIDRQVRADLDEVAVEALRPLES